MEILCFPKVKVALRRATEWWGQHRRKNKQTQFDREHWGTGEVPHLSWCYRCYESQRLEFRTQFPFQRPPMHLFMVSFYIFISA